MENELMHYGTKRHSGRYKWGSGEVPYQHEDWFLSRVRELREQGLPDDVIRKQLGVNSSEFRREMSIARAQERAVNINRVRQLKSHGYANTTIANMVGISEGLVRAYLKDDIDVKDKQQQHAVNMLRRECDKKHYIDVGAGVERYMGVSEESLKTALRQLKNEGYQIQTAYVKQLGTDFTTTVRVLAPPGAEHVSKHLGEIKPVQEFLSDDGKTELGILYPKSIDSKRVFVRYAEDGGEEKDGIIELRKGVQDISLGDSKYAQVRIAVDGDKYMKGVAVYADDKDIPKGYDIIYNSNKSRDRADDVFKSMKRDPNTGEIDKDNPFGATIKRNGQRLYFDENGKQHQSLINKVNEEGDWDKWSKSLSAQFLSKQSIDLIKRQLNYTMEMRRNELKEYESLTNPTIKRKFLEDFADNCDSGAVHLKVEALPRQSSKLILPMNSLKDGEIYAPTYKQGEQVALVRYPHGGIFEIPILTVNNNNPEGKKWFGGDLPDAVGINKKAAAQLSGADFDGDTVLVIPTNSRVHIDAKPAIPSLIEFDNKKSYPEQAGMKYMSKGNKQTEMGKVTNLIADMGLKGANEDEIVRAVKYSMVVIDAEKHKLNYKQAYDDFGIRDLKKQYQTWIDPETGKARTGAGTLITRAKSQERVTKRALYSKIDPETGEKIFFDSKHATYDVVKKDENGNWIPTGETGTRTTKSTKMYERKDARTLMSDNPNPKEILYADYANNLKALANQARLEASKIKDNKQEPSATKLYSKEVESLDKKLDIALKNSPRERYAQVLANNKVRQMVRDNPALKEDRDRMKSIRGSALQGARDKVGARKERINITDDEWKAIQAGAISAHKLTQIMKNADPDRLRELATPTSNRSLSNAQILSAKIKVTSGNYTIAEVADQLGVSPSTVSRLIKETN